MLEKHAFLFTEAVIGLEAGHWVCDRMQAEFTRIPSADDRDNRQLIIATVNHGTHRLRQACILSDMQEFLPEIDRLEAQLAFFETSRTQKPEHIGQSIIHLRNRVQDVLKNEFYFHVDQRDVQFYLAEKPFGGAVADAFEKANEDIAEAAKCVALQRPVACVFHLMRVMERGVQKLGKRLKVKIDVQNETWHQIILHVNNAVLALPSQTGAQKKKKSDLAGAAAHLQSVRLAWRNEVMHPKQTYTRDEALTIFNNCKVFMQHLVEII